MTTIVKFTFTEWPMRFGGYECVPLNKDMSGEYVPLAEYDKLKDLIQRAISIGNELFADPELSPNWHWKDYLMDLDKLVVDCKEVLK